MERLNSKATSQSVYIDSPYTDMQLGFGDVQKPSLLLAYGPRTINGHPRDYQEEIAQCRFFYRYDPMASTVINRMVDIAITPVSNRRAGCTDEALWYFNAIAEQIEPVLSAIALEYLITGMAIPDYVKDRIMGSKLHPKLGRTRYTYPRSVWVRNPEHITLKRIPVSMDRAVYLKISDDERYFITHEGEYKDGTKDPELYRKMVQQFPEYVALVREGKSTIPLPMVRPVLRKVMPTQDYPQPYLVPALAALKHKQRIKRMDYSIASKAIDAIRLVTAGSDDFPLEEDDPMLGDLKMQMNSRDNSFTDTIYTLFTNHTVKMEWIFPPLDALLSQDKYAAPNSDILVAMGFSKVLLIGESERSNAGQQNNSTIGPIATLNELRQAVLRWTSQLYAELAEENGFSTYPKPAFRPLSAGDLAALTNFAVEAVKMRALSRDTIARLVGSDFDTEYEQRTFEDTLDPAPVAATPDQTQTASPTGE